VCVLGDERVWVGVYKMKKEGKKKRRRLSFFPVFRISSYPLFLTSFFVYYRISAGFLLRSIYIFRVSNLSLALVSISRVQQQLAVVSAKLWCVLCVLLLLLAVVVGGCGCAESVLCASFSL
jgi:hypothetical protein